MRYVYYQYTIKDKNGENVECVKCVSHFAHKEVQGVAKCHPKDEFDLEKGKEIARARCDVKVAEKRLKQAFLEVAKANMGLEYYEWLAQKKQEYVEDALKELEAYQEKLYQVDPCQKNKDN